MDCNNRRIGGKSLDTPANSVLDDIMATQEVMKHEKINGLAGVCDY